MCNGSEMVAVQRNYILHFLDEVSIFPVIWQLFMPNIFAMILCLLALKVSYIDLYIDLTWQRALHSISQYSDSLNNQKKFSDIWKTEVKLLRKYEELMKKPV